MRQRNAIPRNKREGEARERALAVLSLMRREHLSFKEAVKSAKTNAATVKKYVGSALEKGPTGRYVAKARDRLARTLNFYTSRGPEGITVRDSRIASKIGEYMNAAKLYLTGRDTSAFERFRAKSFRAGGVTHTFITDTDILDRIGEAGFPTEGLYRAVQGATI